ncbi:class I SAM-dependent methyltransferase [Streptomyces sp. NPDC051771]|uniref:class I SAM-dependent methyltransferase n=1 Tax=Streptomyces sp. NPDC051771 TaxID=3154847 RepID=UPI0034352D3E
MNRQAYVPADKPGELERLQLQSRVWEPSGRRLLGEIGEGQGARVLDVGCGALCWLRVLSDWVGSDGEVVGTDIDDSMLDAAGQFVAETGLTNVLLIKDDLFHSGLEPSSFDLVHARFQIAPLGRGPEQMAAHLRLVRPGGTAALEEIDPLSWHFLPPAPALVAPLSRGAEVRGLIPLLGEALHRAGGDPDAAATQLNLFRDAGIEVNVRAEVQALPPGHPYLGMPLQFAAELNEQLRSLVGAAELNRLLQEAERELQDPDRWGLTFTLVQCWGRRAT